MTGEGQGTREALAQTLEEYADNTDLLYPPLKQIRAAAAELRRSDWQDIATAPKDGTRIDIYATTWRPAFNDFVGERFPNCVWMSGDSMSNRAPYWLNLHKDWHPTHWQPLPAPPEVTP